MKKNLHYLFLCFFAVAVLRNSSTAQLQAGSIAPNWTFNDMNGQSHTLYNYLDSGYAVIMDISATWCSPCWSYHQSGALENLYNQYGPPGTKEVMVLWVEGDGATSDGCMTNSGCVDPNNNNQTQGCWTCGTPFPMFNPPSSQANTFNNNYAIGYFPTVYRICPNRILKEITQPTAAEAYAECQTCPPPANQSNDPAMLMYKGTTVSCGSVSIKVLIQNNGLTPLTACTITATIGGNQVAQINWTGSLATYATQTVTVGTATINSTSDITITITSADDNAVNNSITQTVIYKQPQGIPITADFENGSFPNAWNQENPDGDAVAWTVYGSTGGFGNSSSSAFLELYNSASGNIDNLTTTAYDLTYATAPIKMTFDVAYAQYQAENDKLVVRGSTNCGTSWVNKYSKSGSTLKTAPATTSPFTPTASQWRNDTVDVSSFAGQGNVVFQFNVTSAYGNNLFIDNVNIVPANVGIASKSHTQDIRIAPNPSRGLVSIYSDFSGSNPVEAIVYNILGEVVLYLNEAVAEGNFIRLDLSGQPIGIYTVKVVTDGATAIEKVSISR